MHLIVLKVPITIQAHKTMAGGVHDPSMTKMRVTCVRTWSMATSASQESTIRINTDANKITENSKYYKRYR